MSEFGGAAEHSGYYPNSGFGKDDIIIKNKNDNEITRIITPGKDVEVKLDTNITPPIPLILDPVKESSNRQESIDAIGFNFGYSGTVGGGMEGGLSVMYFINGKDSGNVGVYSYVGGNVGLGGGLGVEYVVSHFNRSLSTFKDFTAEGFSGKYNRYSAQTPIGGYSMSWSNVKMNFR